MSLVIDVLRHAQDLSHAALLVLLAIARLCRRTWRTGLSLTGHTEASTALAYATSGMRAGMRDGWLSACGAAAGAREAAAQRYTPWLHAGARPRTGFGDAGYPHMMRGPNLRL